MVCAVRSCAPRLLSAPVARTGISVGIQLRYRPNLRPISVAARIGEVISILRSWCLRHRAAWPRFARAGFAYLRTL